MMSDINCVNREIALAQIGAAQLRLQGKGRATKELVAYNRWDLESLDLLNGLL